MKAEAKLYLSHHCPYCKMLEDNLVQVKQNFDAIGMNVKLIFFEEDRELFAINGFEAVPILVMPNRRPRHPIDPAWIIDPNKFSRIAMGDIPSSVTMHKTSLDRIKQGVSDNKKFSLKTY